MTRIVTILTEGFADWETTMLNAVAKGYYQIDTAYASPGGRKVTSMGGLTVTPDLVLEDLDPKKLDVLVICGGTAWKAAGAPDLTDLVRRTRAAERTIAAICDGTVALARTGALDTVAHTSNGVGYLDETGYAGAAHYRDSPEAVVDDGIITASATAPVSLMEATLGAIGLADDQLHHYVLMHAAQFGGARAPA